MANLICLEAWTVPRDDDEELCELEMVDSEEFPKKQSRLAKKWIWQKLEEGYDVRMFLRRE